MQKESIGKEDSTERYDIRRAEQDHSHRRTLCCFLLIFPPALHAALLGLAATPQFQGGLGILIAALPWLSSSLLLATRQHVTHNCYQQGLHPVDTNKIWGKFGRRCANAKGLCYSWHVNNALLSIVISASTEKGSARFHHSNIA